MPERTYFYTVHRTKPSDTLYKLTAAYRLGNPAAIVDFPPNRQIFAVRRDLGWMPDIQLTPEERPVVFIPWHPEALLEFAGQKIRERVRAVEASQRRLAAVGASLARMEKSVQKDLAYIDAVATFATMFVSLGATVYSSVKLSKVVELGAKAPAMAGKSATAVTAELTRRKAQYVADALMGLAVQPPIGMLLPQPADLGHGWRWWLSNTLGWWNPSKWAGVYVAAKEGDVDIAFHGTGAVSKKQFNRALAREQRALKRKSALIEQALRAAARQANDPYYHKRYRLLTAPLGPRSWRVSSGDSLTSISRRFYNTDEHWMTIYEANREIIGPDPDRLCVGVSLDIPYLR